MASGPADILRQADVMDPARACAMQVILGQRADIGAGDRLPPFFHQLYFWAPEAPAALGRDGHPMVGGLIPDMGLPRRMWAAGRLQFDAPLRAGIPAERRSTREAHQRKQGRSGPLGFVTLRHEIWQAGACCVTEWQELVYREDHSPGAPRPNMPKTCKDAQIVQDVTFSETLLFRYSALTLNGHRIHYDLDYARDVEGYDGLVVHGPLLAQFLMLKAEDELGPLTQFQFRATAPLMHFETATLCRNGSDLWVLGPEGRQCMVASARS